MTYEERMQLLNSVRPEKKDILLLKLARGEKIDLTKDSDLFYQINANRMSMDDWMKQDRLTPQIQSMKDAKANIYDTKYGQTKGKKMRWLGDIPDWVYFNHPHLFGPMVPREERTRNIKKWLNENPLFKAGDAKL